MVKFAIILSILLVFVILYLLFRIQILTSVFRGNYEKQVAPANKVNAWLMLAFLILGGIAFVWSWVVSQDEMILPVASQHGVLTDNMFWLTMVVIGIVFVITQVMLFVYAYIYQHKDGRRAYYYSHNNKLEVVWTMIPAVVMALLVFGGWKTWANITSPAPKESVVVEIMGKQFNWMARYPGADQKLGVVKHTLIDATNEFGMDFTDPNAMDDFMPREIHVPKGQPVLLKIRARDVLHSVYIPHFRVKMDAVPGMPTKFWFVPTKTTEEMQVETGNANFKYEIACAEICGRGHFAMKMIIVVEEPEDYEEWVKAQKPFVEENPGVLANLKTNAKELVLNETSAIQK